MSFSMECDTKIYTLFSELSSVTMNLKTFKVTLSSVDNPDKFKFIVVDECVDMDDCINHVHSTEKEFIIDAIRELY